MGLLGFTVFKEKILNNEKCQTIRLLRKRVPKAGEKLWLYWKLRTKACEFLKEVICIEVLIKEWKDMKNDVDLAKRDGFDSLKEFQAWFNRYSPQDDTKFLIIRWKGGKKI